LVCCIFRSFLPVLVVVLILEWVPVLGRVPA
jgi:hypothetical protein